MGCTQRQNNRTVSHVNAKFSFLTQIDFSSTSTAQCLFKSKHSCLRLRGFSFNCVCQTINLKGKVILRLQCDSICGAQTFQTAISVVKIRMSYLILIIPKTYICIFLSEFSNSAVLQARLSLSNYLKTGFVQMIFQNLKPTELIC